MAALQIGCEMPYHVIDKTADELTDEDIRELRIADNQTNAETGMDWDTLEAELADLSFDGFDFDFADMFEEKRGEEDTHVEPYTGTGAKEYDPEDYSDERFKCECPRCGIQIQSINFRGNGISQICRKLRKTGKLFSLVFLAAAVHLWATNLQDMMLLAM
jgi:hypothetical protein